MSAPSSPRSEAPLLLHVFPTFAAGGAQVRTTRLMAAFGDVYRHAVLALDGCTDARSLVPDEIACELIEGPSKAGSFATTRVLFKLMRARRPALVATYNWGSIDAVCAARLLGIATVHHEDGFGPDEALGFKRRREWSTLR